MKKYSPLDERCSSPNTPFSLCAMQYGVHTGSVLLVRVCVCVRTCKIKFLFSGIFSFLFFSIFYTQGPFFLKFDTNFPLDILFPY